MRILIADSSKDELSSLSEYLVKKYKYDVDLAYDGASAKEMYSKNKYDFVILCDDLPLIPGFSLIQIFRRIYNCYITISSNRNDSFYQKYIYSNGANDLIQKPYDNELIGFLISNYLALSQKKNLQIGGISIDDLGRMLYVDGESKVLTLKEFDLLMYLIKNKGKAVSRDEIFKEVWGYQGQSSDDRTIDTHIKMLRNQLGRYKTYIETYRGYGYKFEVK